MKIELYNSNCLVEIDKLIEQGIKVDSIITDPPYETTGFKWDKNVISEELFDKLFLLLKDNGALVLFSLDPFSTYIKSIGIKKEVYKYDWIWVKSRISGHFNAKVKPLKNYENICVFSKSNTSAGREGNMIYNPQGLNDCEIYKKNVDLEYGKKGTYQRLRPSQKEIHKQTKTGYPKDVIHFNNTKKETKHPTEKPVDLLEYLIKTYTNEGDTVLDFTMGSGSTGVACKNLNRNFIGIELDEEYFKIAEKRIK